MPLITLSAEIQSEQIGQRLDQTLAELFLSLQIKNLD